jgi:hypothetical protein
MRFDNDDASTRHRDEYATSEEVTLDFGETDFDPIEPRLVSGCEVKPSAEVLFQKPFDRILRFRWVFFGRRVCIAGVALRGWPP